MNCHPCALRASTGSSKTYAMLLPVVAEVWALKADFPGLSRLEIFFVNRTSTFCGAFLMSQKIFLFSTLHIEIRQAGQGRKIFIPALNQSLEMVLTGKRII